MNKLSNEPEAEFKELEPRLKYGLFHLELHLMFQDLSRRSNKTVIGGFETRLKFIKLGHGAISMKQPVTIFPRRAKQMCFDRLKKITN